MDDTPPVSADDSSVRRAAIGTAKAALVAVTLLFLSSIGGAMLFAFPVLVPLHWLAARGAGRWGTAGWAALAAASVFEAGWMIVYALSGDEFIAMFIGVLAAIAVAWAFATRRRNRLRAATPGSGR